MPMIEIQKISKWYGDFQVLTDCTTSIEKGEVVVVCGPSGSGKSTLIKTALGLLEPQKGRVMINNKPVRSLDPTEIRGLIGYVPQDPLLFSGSIRENILLGCREGQNLTDEELFRIIEVSRLTEEIE